eukprot:TRINITY_DN274_c0_g1_i6.p1 TRINITY_DN274_c0_g1~~TRINITY_DN274_c0_g1_i6.p1  ORF type:complete len:215 (+),score=57.42 TRINITY_DN274_c0_g1_i6:611-1255(+)
MVHAVESTEYRTPEHHTAPYTPFHSSGGYETPHTWSGGVYEAPCSSVDTHPALSSLVDNSYSYDQPAGHASRYALPESTLARLSGSPDSEYGSPSLEDQPAVCTLPRKKERRRRPLTRAEAHRQKKNDWYRGTEVAGVLYGKQQDAGISPVVLNRQPRPEPNPEPKFFAASKALGHLDSNSLARWTAPVGKPAVAVHPKERNLQGNGDIICWSI